MPLSDPGTVLAGTKTDPARAASPIPAHDRTSPEVEESARFISPDHEAEYRAFIAEHPDIEAVEFLMVDPNGVMRGKWAPGDALKKAFQEGVNFPMSLHGLDVWGREVTETGLHIETGDKDGYCRATRGSLSMVPWAKRRTAQVLLQTFSPEGEPFMADPRQVLKKKIAEVNAKGFFPVVAFELEFYLLDPELEWSDGMPGPVGDACSDPSPRPRGRGDRSGRYASFALTSSATFAGTSS